LYAAPVLDDLIIAHCKLVANMEARSHERLAVHPRKQDARPVVAGVQEYA
jgi:hypothetical protein